MQKPNCAAAAIAFAVGLTGPIGAAAAVTAEQVARLDGDLTPVGAERAGNADGSIPPWTGGLPKSPPIDPLVGYIDPFAQDPLLFPIPADGLQVMWNHVFRWRGGSFVRQIAWFPVARNGRYFKVRFRDAFAFDQQGYMAQSRPNRLYNAYGFYLDPPEFAGRCICSGSR